MTERTPDVRLSEANKQSNEWSTGHFELEFAKKVSNPKDKETTLHSILASKRVPGKEFFDISLDELILHFCLMDGEMWPLSTVSKNEPLPDLQQNEVVSDLPASRKKPVSRKKPASKKKVRGPPPGCRTMAALFKHGQRIRHDIKKDKTWYGTYDSMKNCIVGSNGEVYKSPSRFAETHMKVDHPTVKHERNGWEHGKYEVNGTWVSMFELPCNPAKCPNQCTLKR